ncbi:hypothetical protein KK137_03280 [Croceibacterium sp. LX-88]|jgi:hypothetical protein|uniref:17 kDa surface antigen n=1 Tax=Croceibacterium selenioxidans TaxID=2838833 RepID=A0ABS5W240_9SPHN|nr:hypothetical protein [Croceibacterium selenioxidans]MBT2133348.1 hypothetical protein [Croceibacterium selenioxidans]
MTSISKALVGTIAAGAMAVTATVPAQAQSRNHRDNDGIDAGDIIAGALIIGGIAAVASAVGRDNDRYNRYDGGDYGRYDRGYDNRYARAGNPRQAVEQCVNAAERGANRSYRGNSQVTDIRNIDRKRDGYTVKGRIAVNTAGRDWRRGDAVYGRGWNGDYRGWNNNYRGYDAGSFTCKVRYGQVVDLDYNGIRGLG